MKRNKLRGWAIKVTHHYASIRGARIENHRLVKLLTNASTHKTSDHLDYDWPVRISQEQIAKNVDCYCNYNFEHALTFMNEGKRWQG